MFVALSLQSRHVYVCDSLAMCAALAVACTPGSRNNPIYAIAVQQRWRVVSTGDETLVYRSGVRVSDATVNRMNSLFSDFVDWLANEKDWDRVSVSASLNSELTRWKSAVGLSAADAVLVRAILAADVEADLGAHLTNISAL